MTDPHEIKNSLMEEIGKLREASVNGCSENAKAHREVFKVLEGFKGDRKVLITVATVLGILFGGTGTYVVTRTEALAEEIDAVRLEERGNAREGFQLADDLRNDVDHNEDDIAGLQVLHRSRGNESNGLKPGRSN
jgi:hypothetical protein